MEGGKEWICLIVLENTNVHPQSFSTAVGKWGMNTAEREQAILRMTQICNLFTTTCLFFSPSFSVSSSIDIALSLCFAHLPTLVFFSSQIWDKQSLECLKILTGHTGSVLCLQYDERVIVTGSSDSTVRYDRQSFTEPTHC